MERTEGFMRKSILLLAIMVCSCGPARIVTEFQRDSVIVHVRDSVFIRDTIVNAEIPAESGANILPDTDTSFLATSLAESRAFVKGGRLHHTLRNRSEMLLPVKVQYVDRARYEQKDSIGWRQMVETVEVEKELSRWQSFIMSLGYAVLIAGSAWLVWKLSRMLSFS
jgi:hypothetical protein